MAHTFAAVEARGAHSERLGGRTETHAERRDRALDTLLVLAWSDENVTAINLSEISGLHSADAFDVINRFTTAELDTLVRQAQPSRTYALKQLVGMGPRGLAHIAAGTNYPAHGEETGVAGAFLFPKLSEPTGPRASITAAPGVLLDYEVEVCARFDREIRSVSDFDEARKGFFVCGDYSDRADMMRNLDLRNVQSGDGFPDAKSGPERFPAGPFLVVPRDWKSFVNELVIETYVNGQRRQHASARVMIKDLRTIVQETLHEAQTRTWAYHGRRIPMVDRPAISTASAVLTGTGEGVVFQQPAREVLAALMQAKDRSEQLAIIERYIAGEIAKRIYLQAGHHVTYTSNYLGSIENRVVPHVR